MNLLVYLTDGRTVYLVERRGRLRDLTTWEPWHEKESVRIARGTWNPVTGEWFWEAVRLRFLRKASIARIEEAPFGIASVVPSEEAA